MAALAGVSASVAASSFCSSSSCRYSSPRTSAPLSVVFSVGSPAVRLGRLIWNGQKSNKQRTHASAPSNIVAAPAAAVVEEVAVTTESVPRPKKIGKGVVRLRLARLGRKKRPFYRIVATHSSWRRDGKYIELLGHYNPLHAKDDLGIVVKADRIKYWLGVGAQPSDTVTGILHKVGILKAAPRFAVEPQ